LDFVRTHFNKRIEEQVADAQYRAQYSGRCTIMARDIKVKAEDNAQKTKLSSAGCKRLVRQSASNMHIAQNAYKNIQLNAEHELREWLKNIDSSDEEKAVLLEKYAPTKTPSEIVAPFKISLKPVFRTLVKNAGIELQTSSNAKKEYEKIVGSIGNLLIRESNTDAKTINSSNVELACKIWLLPEQAEESITFAKQAVEKYKTSKDTTRSRRAGLLLPVSSVENAIRKECAGKNISETTPVFLTAVLESLLQKIMVSASQTTQNLKKRTVTTEHVKNTMSSIKEYRRLYAQ
jgi:histone H3/H4